MASYNHKENEEKWRKKWEEEKIYRTDADSSKKKWYGLVEFPYPSGAGLHVGHVRSYTAMDIIARKRRAEGYEVLFPIGWDAFGLPAENYAIKTGIHPSITTKDNIANFRKQLKACGFSFDWDREVDTTDPEYYTWSQWIFLKLYERGLAYKKKMPVNWCPKDKCVLANEEVVDGACERCGTHVTKKDKEQWMLAITKYAERLHRDLDETEYLEKIKIQQRNWIGLSEGSEITFGVEGKDFTGSFDIFTTRADTIFGCTYCVLAPEHPLVEDLISKNALQNSAEVISYRESAKNKLDIDRSAEGKEKTGVKLEGVSAINPANQETVPIFIADYVLPQYGTGAIMAVPAHDERDYEFALKYSVPVKQVIQPVRIDKNNPHVSGYPLVERNMVHGIIRDPKTNTYLMLTWKSNPWTTFVLGGVEEGEDEYDSILREIHEETGLTNLKFLYKSITAYSEYCANHKQQNRVAHPVGYFFEITEETIQEKISDEENKKHEVSWVDISKELPKNFTCSEWDIFKQTIVAKGFYPSGEDGVLFNSEKFNGMQSLEARKKITEALGGKIVIKSKIRDWVFARQRYWGEPIPIVYDKKGDMYPVSASELPIILPQVSQYEPTDNGESPLAQVHDWVTIKGRINETGHFVTDANEEEFRRETDTMPQWAGSSWYFMRYIDPTNSKEIARTDLLAKWLPVDWYNGGMEHTTLHLLYSRFWYKFLFDIGLVPTSEPYNKRTSQGMILGAGGVKMSKSLGNVINPDDIVASHGADVLRLYEMFIGPFDQAVAWDDKALVGVKRFLDKVVDLSECVVEKDVELDSIFHQSIESISRHIEAMNFNVAVSQAMILTNSLHERVKDARESSPHIAKKEYMVLLKLISPFAPFLSEELWQKCLRDENQSVHTAAWPSFDEEKLLSSVVTVAIQIAGKMRGTIEVARDISGEELLESIKNTEIYKKYVGLTDPKKIIIVKNKIVNIVI